MPIITDDYKKGIKIVPANDNFDSNYYFIEGKYVKRCSLYLNMINKGEWYDLWLMNNGVEAVKIRDDAAASGSKCHNACEEYQKTGKIQLKEPASAVTVNKDLYTKTEVKKLKGFVNWVKDFKPKWLYTESTIWDFEEDYAGTMDILCEIDGKVCLLDIKTGSSIHDNAWFQVAAYKKALEKLIGKKIDHVGIIHLKSTTKKGYQFTMDNDKKKPRNVDNDFQAFLCTKFLFNVMNPNFKPKEQEDVPEYLGGE